MEEKRLRHKVIKKCIIVICIMFIVFGVFSSFFPELYRVIDGKKSYIVYPEFQAPLSGIVELACDMDGNLYVLADQSDCIVAFSPDGKVLYSYFFYSATNGTHSMIALTNNTVLVDLTNFGVSIFNGQGLVKEVEAEDGSYPDAVDKKDVFEKGELATRDKKGNVFEANPFTAQISKTDLRGNKSHFAGDNLEFWLLNWIVPGMLMICAGVLGIYYTKRYMRKKDKTIKYKE